MPTYSYACTACGHTFDVHQSFSDAALTVCPECEGRLRKVFGNVGVVFKGSGFYRTDSRAAGSGKAGAPAREKAGEKTGEKAGETAGKKTGEKTAATSAAKGSGAPAKPAASA